VWRCSKAKRGAKARGESGVIAGVGNGVGRSKPSVRKFDGFGISSAFVGDLIAFILGNFTLTFFVVGLFASAIAL
jgi:hypothetical protein